MKFINNTKEEETICFNCTTRTRENSNKINYFNRVNDKPWGKEYLAYQSKYIGIWILHVNKDQETSLHCHFKKDTILMPIVGCFKINLFDKFIILNLLDTLYVPRETFHGIHSYVDDSILMEIEIYTDKIEYTDKSDLLRIKDIYNRDKNNYETSVVEREPYENEIMYFNTNNKYNINNTYLEIFKIKNIEEIKDKYDKVLLLQGSIFSDGKKITSGTFIDLKNQISILTEYIELLCISNINIKQIQKIIYSKNHLTDYLELNKFNNIGLTSGCFDILHEGHITNLKLCKKNCDHLFVCLSSDKQIKRLKGELRPINNLIDRINMLIHYDFIDILILYDETNDELESELDNIMNIVKPYIWFKGSDYNKQDILKKHPNIKNIQLFDLIKGKSTTNIIQKIIT
jgi:D-beta-D-heptose 7-phosphate kinase/D-beta-D-heptose 1-phosphate adenosyltransferase|uniref:Cytidyltransferase-like domain-containing protein n=1 Tax=viral metagenome TaxID=1070528 RepID=A0A6C0H415_9ZZZZ